MELDITHRLDRRARKLWHISGVIGGLVFSLTLALPVGFLLHGTVGDGDGWPTWWLLWSTLAVTALLVPLIGGVMPALRWHTFRYRIERERLFLQHGVFTIERTLVPLVRIQNVNSSQGPLDRWYGLSDVTVATAAKTHRIPSLPLEVAETLREGIEVLVRQARDDV